MNGSPMRIGIAHHDQLDGLVDLFVELHAYYNSPATATRDDVRTHLKSTLLAAGSPVELVVAEAPDHAIAGFAALVFLPSLVQPNGADRWQCQLKELYVGAAHRNHNVGEALVRWSVTHASDRGCGRMDWNVQAHNAAGIRFYERLGAVAVDDRLSYRLSQQAMTHLASEGCATS